jgi:hypothetical protein
MTSSQQQLLERLNDVCRGNPSLHQLVETLQLIIDSSPSEDDIDEIIRVYETALAILEKSIWSKQQSLETYQQLFRDLEELIATTGNDTRHKFIIIIPVADRPKHLQSCLQSLLTLCQSYHYGGYRNNKFIKVAVVIADDSKQQSNIQKNKEIARYFNTQGLESIYFGQDEQWQQLEHLSKTDRQCLVNILGNFDRSALHHKGPSIMRNITYLKLNEMRQKEDNLLFHFVDSDQEFQVLIQDSVNNAEVYGINYFYELDKIFSHNKIRILTGKVVGDPPVSPAVMAGTFLDDVCAFLYRMANTEAELACQFHQQDQQKEHDAAYHDMAELFGFKSTTEVYHYRCPLAGKHDHAKCFADFAGKLNQFFHGEHPTRKSYFNHVEPVSEIKPARTIYTGNYIFTPDYLSYFIPFARLKLRMAGPTLGRIIKAEIKNGFVSANLPMLHNRTVEDTGKSEFRPGINSEHDKIDLSGEFERQYFGDVMLFSMEKITATGYPEQSIDEQDINKILETTEKDIRQQYAAKQQQIQQKLELLKEVFFDNHNWWNTRDDLEPAKELFRTFIDNIESNFGENSPCYTLIDSASNRDKRFAQMLEAIVNYPANRKAWQAILGL